MVQVVKCLISKLKSLGSNLVSRKQNKNKDLKKVRESESATVKPGEYSNHRGEQGKGPKVF
jgi:hypothetical protein